MKYEGKVYAKVNGRYIECTKTVEDLEKQFDDLIVAKNLELFKNLKFRSEIELLLRDVYQSIDNASIFTRSRLKMHPYGQYLREKLIDKISEKIVEISDSFNTMVSLFRINKNNT